MLFQIKVELRQEKFIEVVPGKQHRYGPGNTAHHIVKHEFLLVHVHDPRNDGGKGADDGYEPCEDDGGTTILIVKFFGSKQVLLFKEESVFALEEIGSALVAKPIAHTVPDHARNYYKGCDEYEVEEITSGVVHFSGQFRTVDARHKEQGITGQEKAGKQTGLRKYDKQKQPQASVLDVEFRIKQVPERNIQKFNHHYGLKFVLVHDFVRVGELTFPFRDGRSGQCIADYIGHGPEHITEVINRQDQRDALRWDVEHGTGCRHHHQ